MHAIQHPVPIVRTLLAEGMSAAGDIGPLDVRDFEEDCDAVVKRSLSLSDLHMSSVG